MRTGSFLFYAMTVEEREIEINRERAELQSRAPELWVKTLGDCARRTGDGFALAGPTCGFCRTAGARWAMDPAYRPPEGDGRDVYDRIAGVFPPLDFLILTHRHRDHLDPMLLALAAERGVEIILPAEILPGVLEKCPALPESAFTALEYGASLTRGKLAISVFPGFHSNARRTVPCGMFRVKMPGRTWLFPGDVRDYGNILPGPPPDLLFANIWLGAHMATQEEFPLLDDFCRFFGRAGAKRIVFAHLQEAARPPDSYWNSRHADIILKRMRELYPETDYTVPNPGVWYELEHNIL